MRKIILIFLILNFGFYLKAQKVELPEFTMSTYPIQFLFNEYSLNFEKLFAQKQTAGFLLSYRPSTKNSGEFEGGGHGVFGDYSSQNYFNPYYNSFTFGLNTKRYISKRNNIYLDLLGFYRHWWFENKTISFDNEEGYRFNGLRTEHQNVYGIKLLIGNTSIISTNSRIKPFLDIYFGLGVRYKAADFKTFNGTVNDIYYDYRNDKNYFWLPSAHFGIKFGAGLMKK